MEDVHIPQHLDFNRQDTNSIRMEVLKDRGNKAIPTAAARESKWLCKRFSKCCRWNSNPG
jgi:hypothetical protein